MESMNEYYVPVEAALGSGLGAYPVTGSWFS